MSLRKSPQLTPQLLAAARQNAQHSTGPRSAAAKQNSKLNTLNLDGMSQAVGGRWGKSRCQVSGAKRIGEFRIRQDVTLVGKDPYLSGSLIRLLSRICGSILAEAGRQACDRARLRWL